MEILQQLIMALTSLLLALQTTIVSLPPQTQIAAVQDAIRPLSNTPPVIFFTDLDSGPNTGGENNNGAFVTIYGKNFGTSPTVTVGGGQALIKLAPRPHLWYEKLVIQLGTSARTGDIIVTAGGQASNAAPFTLRSGAIKCVATAGNDTASGDLTTNACWKTIQFAVDTIAPGDTIYVKDGVAEIVTSSGSDGSVTITRSGTLDKPMSLLAYPGATATIGKTSTAPSFGLPEIAQGISGGVFNGVGPPWHWVIGGFQLKAYDWALSLGGLSVQQPLSHWKIVGNDMTCPFGDGASACLDMGLAAHLRVYGNTLHDIGHVKASGLYHGVYFSSDTSHVDMGWNSIARVRGCRGIQVHSSIFSGVPDSGQNQFDIAIHDNLIHDTQCDGIVLATVDPSKGKVELYNNVIYSAGKGPATLEGSGNFSCIYVAGGTNAGAPGGGVVEVYNNTLYDCGAFSVYTDGSGRGAVENGGSNPNLRVRIRNNIIYSKPGEPYLEIWTTQNICLDTDNCPGVFGSNNLFFGNGPAPSNTNITNSINIDPQFVDLTKRDFRLKTNSQAIGAGVAIIGLATDREGVSRPQGPTHDIGAYEFVSSISPLPAPPSLKEDFNGDGVVNSLDFSLLNRKWNQTTNIAIYDLNSDGIINSLDHSILTGKWFMRQ